MLPTHTTQGEAELFCVGGQGPDSQSAPRSAPGRRFLPSLFNPQQYCERNKSVCRPGVTDGKLGLKGNKVALMVTSSKLAAPLAAAVCGRSC